MNKVDLDIGDVLIFSYPYEDQNKKWSVRTTSDRFAILTLNWNDSEIIYTIVDWCREVRGPVNLTGGWYDIRIESLTEDANKLLGDLQNDLEVSYRNNVPIRIKEIIRKNKVT